MPITLLSCDTDCTFCCRYPEFLPNEISLYAQHFPIGLRLSLLPMPDKLSKYFLLRNLEKTLPKCRKYFLECRIIGIGYTSQFLSICSRYTKKKKERNDKNCKGVRPILCAARPLNPFLPTEIQLESLYQAHTVYNCLGISTTLGSPILKTGIFSTKVLGERGKNYLEARNVLEDFLPTYQILADHIFENKKDCFATLESGMARNTFYILPIHHFLKAMYVSDRITVPEITEILDAQKKIIKEDIDLFLQTYGDKTVFPEKKRPDGETYMPDRGMYIRRFSDWILEYDKILANINSEKQ